MPDLIPASWKRLTGKLVSREPEISESQLYTSSMSSKTQLYAPYRIESSEAFRLGDYGMIDPVTLSFVPRGNVADFPAPVGHPNVKQELQDILCKPEEVDGGTLVPYCAGTATQNLSVLSSDDGSHWHARTKDFRFREGWLFGRGVFASLVVVAPNTISIHPKSSVQFFDGLRKIQDERIFDFSGYLIVTSLQTCESYANFVGQGQGGKAYYGFRPEGTSNNPQHSQWNTYSSQSLWNTGLWSPGQQKYTALIGLKDIDGNSADVAQVFRG